MPDGYQDRTDSIAEKARLLQQAYKAGRMDVAMSLVESMKETLNFEQQDRGTRERPQIAAQEFAAVRTLPQACSRWAHGWSHCKSISLFETVGEARANEPVDLAIAFQANQVTDLQREVRIVRVDERTQTMHEVPSQIYREVRRGKERQCRLVFFGDVPAHGRTNYLIFYGNPHAELPDYATDLRTHGEGYGLDIENNHYVARLSRQMGSLERLTYKRQHGLELFAGGKGHGEPPTIDWSNDYVDPGHFQKLRLRNWPECPNYEVVKGPLCVQVRRWGFPLSPIHPLFTPSRMHMDQTYTFYAGLPYFFKEGSMEVIKDMRIEAMRDDEWVFSGYSFTDSVWIDAQGRLHEGRVPKQHAQNLWGVGFYHRDSRDSFIALWLQHAADNFKGIQHGGAPTLHYDGHGQLWSRYPANRAAFKAGTTFRQKNAYLLAPFAKNGAAARVQRLRHRLVNPLQARTEKAPRTAGAKATGALARPGETEQSAPLKTAVWRALREVRDEQLYKANANIVDMGYVYDVCVRDDVVHVLLTMPHRGRPVYDFLVTAGGGRVSAGLRERLLKVRGVRNVVVNFTWNPPWTVARLTDAGRQAMGLDK